MAFVSSFNLPGINLYTNPLIHDFNQQVTSDDGQLLRAVNVTSEPHGAKSKRPGYGTYNAGSAPNGQSAQSLFSWLQDSGTQLYTYLAAGTSLYYSLQGTGAWTICGNGTITSGSQVGYSVLNNTLIISQNGGTTRHTTNGTSFTDTTAAPAGGYIEQFQNRIFITGTSFTLTYSDTGDPTNWGIGGTNDSSSFTIPGGGLPNRLFKLADRLYISKAQGQIFRWDGNALLDLATSMGLSSPWSYGSVEDNGFWLNRLGIVTSSGDQPQTISNPIKRYFYNDVGTPVAGTSFGTAPGVVHRYDYYLAVGSMTDDFTFETVPNAIIKYNFQKNEFLNYSFANFPTAMHSYRDTTGSQQFIFADATGQCYTFGNQNLNDNGTPIESIIEIVFHANAPYLQKDWRNFWGFFNPGCEAQVLYACSDTFLKEEKNWQTLGDATQGVVRFRFPSGTRSRLLYIKIIESSRNTRFNYYGSALEFDPVQTP